jgi:hypothetical protein
VRRSEHHLLSRAELHTTGQVVQSLWRDVPHPTIGYQDGLALVPRCGVQRADDVHPHEQSTSCRCKWNSDGAWVRSSSSFRMHMYKRAVVGLVELFYYPMIAGDISKADPKAHGQSLYELYFG